MRHSSRPTGDLPLSPPCKALLPSCEPRKLWHGAHAAFLEPTTAPVAADLSPPFNRINQHVGVHTTRHKTHAKNIIMHHSCIINHKYVDTCLWQVKIRSEESIQH